jgi:SWI/SNF-related matrix-associated actin-dependent regulator of chromatin subfamily A3
MASDIQALVYYGPERERNLERFSQYNIVITTYNVVASEWKERNRATRRQGQSRRLHSFAWHRIVLDEGISRPSSLNP